MITPVEAAPEAAESGLAAVTQLPSSGPCRQKGYLYTLQPVPLMTLIGIQMYEHKVCGTEQLTCRLSAFAPFLSTLSSFAADLIAFPRFLSTIFTNSAAPPKVIAYARHC